MREIKFRAWDKEANLWAGLDYLQFSNGKLYWTNNNEIADKVILMQFTGLTDKNGKEIYEGDIFDCIYKFDGCINHKLEVVWHNESASFRLKNHGECHQPNVEKRVSNMERKEVIGNIYENPGLISRNN